MKIISIIFFVSLIASNISNSAEPDFRRQKTSNKTLIINSFDASLMDARKKKKELFAQLADSLTRMLSNDLRSMFNDEGIIHPLVISLQNRDSTIYSLIRQYQVTRAIVIDTLNVFFEQTGVVVTKDKDGKSRVASYDICAFAHYSSYDTYAKKDSRENENCDFFTERSTMSGLLATGPDIVVKRKYAFRILEENAKKYLRSVYRF